MAYSKISELAERFLKVTYNHWGTEEGDVDQILLKVHENGWRRAFDDAVAMRLTGKEKANLLEDPSGSVVAAILRDEFYFDAAYNKRVDLYRYGEERNASGYFSHIGEGGMIISLTTHQELSAMGVNWLPLSLSG